MRDARVADERARRWQLAAAVGDAQALAAGVDATSRRVSQARGAIAHALAERDRLASAGTSSGQLAQLDRYLGRLRGDLAAARAAEQRASARHHGQLAEVDASRGRLGRARADREVIDRHFAAWRTERTRRAERRED